MSAAGAVRSNNHNPAALLMSSYAGRWGLQSLSYFGVNSAARFACTAFISTSIALFAGDASEKVCIDNHNENTPGYTSSLVGIGRKLLNSFLSGLYYGSTTGVFRPCALSVICGTISKILTLRVKREFCVLVVRLWRAAGSTRQTFCWLLIER